MKSGIELIAEERKRQVEEGFEIHYDVKWGAGSLLVKASEYPDISAEPIDNLIQSGALIAAEIDRLQAKVNGKQIEKLKESLYPEQGHRDNWPTEGFDKRQQAKEE